MSKIKSRKVRVQQTMKMELQGKKEKRNRIGFGLTVIICLAVVGGMFASLYFGGQWVYQKCFSENPKYSIAGVDIKIQGRLSKEYVLKLAQVELGGSIFGVDVNAIRRRIEEEPCVSYAVVKTDISKMLIRIEVFERQPVARIQGVQVGRHNQYLTLDRTGMVMLSRNLEQTRPLAEIRGDVLAKALPGKILEDRGLSAALHLIGVYERSLARTEDEIVCVEIEKFGVLVAQMKRGGRVLFSADTRQIPLQVDRLSRIMNYCAEHGKTVATADLAVPKNVPVTFKNTEG